MSDNIWNHVLMGDFKVPDFQDFDEDDLFEPPRKQPRIGLDNNSHLGSDAEFVDDISDIGDTSQAQDENRIVRDIFNQAGGNAIAGRSDKTSDHDNHSTATASGPVQTNGGLAEQQSVLDAHDLTARLQCAQQGQSGRATPLDQIAGNETQRNACAVMEACLKIRRNSETLMESFRKVIKSYTANANKSRELDPAEDDGIKEINRLLDLKDPAQFFQTLGSQLLMWNPASTNEQEEESEDEHETQENSDEMVEEHSEDNSGGNTSHNENLLQKCMDLANISAKDDACEDPGDEELQFPCSWNPLANNQNVPQPNVVTIYERIERVFDRVFEQMDWHIKKGNGSKKMISVCGRTLCNSMFDLKEIWERNLEGRKMDHVAKAKVFDKKKINAIDKFLRWILQKKLSKRDRRMQKFIEYNEDADKPGLEKLDHKHFLDCIMTHYTSETRRKLVKLVILLCILLQ